MADQTAEEQEAIKRKRVFKKFQFRGVDLDALLDKKPAEVIQLLPARLRRRFNRGLTRKHTTLLKKLRKAKRDVKPMEKPATVRTHLRNMPVLPEMVGAMVAVYSGKVFNVVEIRPEMIVSGARSGTRGSREGVAEGAALARGSPPGEACRAWGLRRGLARRPRPPASLPPPGRVGWPAAVRPALGGPSPSRELALARAGLPAARQAGLEGLCPMLRAGKRIRDGLVRSGRGHCDGSTRGRAARPRRLARSSGSRVCPRPQRVLGSRGEEAGGRTSGEVGSGTPRPARSGARGRRARAAAAPLRASRAGLRRPRQ